MPRLQQLHGEPCLLQARMEPLRQRPRLKADPRQREGKRLESGDQGLRLARKLRRHDEGAREAAIPIPKLPS